MQNGIFFLGFQEREKMKNTEKKIHKVHKVCSLNVIRPIPVIS